MFGPGERRFPLPEIISAGPLYLCFLAFFPPPHTEFLALYRAGRAFYLAA